MRIRNTLRAGVLLGAMLMAGAAQAAGAMHVLKNSGCGCCVAWVDRLRGAGFEVTTEDVTSGALVQAKAQAGLTAELASCHTARIDGYVVEGHVPAREIARLLDERPEAIGLVVPGMPLGSPGMDLGDETEAYDVLLLLHDGSTEVYASYP